MTDVLLIDPDADIYAAGIAEALPDVRVHTDPGSASAAQVVVALAHAIDAGLVRALPNLRFIQALTTGTDHLDALPLKPGVAIASARGIHGPQMAEMAFLHMLALARDFPAMRDNQVRRAWVRWPQRLLFGKTVVLVGLGAIAEALAPRCQAFGMRVVGVSDGRQKAPGCDTVLPRGALTEAAGMADFLVVLVPLAPATERLIDAAVLAAMKPDGMLINLARGRVVDETALIAGLRAGRPAGAGLDVFETEPLPPDSPLWTMPNVVVTPHLGGMSDIYARQALPLVIDNLRIWRQGNPEQLRNLVRIVA